MRLNDNFHLSYCSNIHPGENWQKTFDSLKENLPKIKAKISPDQEFGLGLRLSNKASVELSQNNNLKEFSEWLVQNNCYVFTMNGFPYGNFHDEKVKDKVHEPDWTTQERLSYTLRLFEQLAILLPEGLEGGISTSPISYRHWFEGDLEKQIAMEKGAANMVEVAFNLHEIESETGKFLHLDVEPEPDGLLENTTEVLEFFENFLVPAAVSRFNSIGKSPEEATDLLKRHITLCYDVCHFALAFEAPDNTFQRLAEAGIQIGKIQISAALKILESKESTSEIWDALAAFNEPTYLHQVTELIDGKVVTYSDLPEVLKKQAPFTELRAHFHVPIFLQEFGLLKSTQDQIVDTFSYLEDNPGLTKHLEVETYTWDVLPKNLKIPIVDSIVRELNWVKSQL
ncbi:metabolite traffic protein EboE [Croceivirga thetidis]|uniref:Metabolite traffic protein EboE n=1 Tax=Croceivirga thetidis TaxID=2721623 RepID=A0ABX1GPU1_9FLAO|nr:metabolite traffic protein EboE [Croceivirga thetidis]NKI31933.1 metabolite traffic protein EboE [Croceivirga thetidis]